MKIDNTTLGDLNIVEFPIIEDSRGSFSRLFCLNELRNELKDKSIIQINQSKTLLLGSVRGMHFQLPPHDHEKLVYVPKGSILDVIVDLRKKSKTYKKFISVNLSDENKKSIFIPKGLAHGFKSLENDTITVYNVATEYNPIADMGIKFDSFGFNWETEEPIVSERDSAFDFFNEFKTPF